MLQCCNQTEPPAYLEAFLCHLKVEDDNKTMALRRRASEEEVTRSGRVLCFRHQSADISSPALMSLLLASLATEKNPTRPSSLSYSYSYIVLLFCSSRSTLVADVRIAASQAATGIVETKLCCVDSVEASFWIQGGRLAVVLSQ